VVKAALVAIRERQQATVASIVSMSITAVVLRRSAIIGTCWEDTVSRAERMP
jgi:hypothetical protein